jgi:zinc and cadmium transporter
MLEVWIYSLVSVLIISLASFAGVFTLSLGTKRLKKMLIYMISFSAGALFGGAFVHLLPHAVEEHGFNFWVSLFVLSGIVLFFVLEKIVHWRHCHHPTCDEHPHTLATMNLFGDGVHNFIDGLIIGASFLISIPVGVATSVAVLLHEIPQEIGDFGVLMYAGYSKGKALLMNFLIALTAFGGVIVALVVGSYVENISMFLVPFAAGGFIYIAGSDLIPELHKEVGLKRAALQLLTFVLGLGVMFLITLMEH